MVWGSFLIAAATLKAPTRNGYNAQGVNLTFYIFWSFLGGGKRLRDESGNVVTVKKGLDGKPVITDGELYNK